MGEEVSEKRGKAQMALQTQLDELVEMLAAKVPVDSKLAYADGCWRVYQTGHWRLMRSEEREGMERQLAELAPRVGLVYAQKKWIIDTHIRLADEFALDTSGFDQKPYVAFRNGTLNLVSGQLEEHSPDHMTTRFVNIDFDPDAKCPHWEQMIADVLTSDEEDTAKRVAFVQEWMGVALVGGADNRTPRTLRKAIFLWGPPNCGKSTVLEVLRRLLGMDRVVASRPGDVNQRFGLEAFLGAAAWITEEVEGNKNGIDTSRIKCLITGEPVSAQRKGLGDTPLRFNGPVAWAGNTAPSFMESSGAVYDRIITLQVSRVFTEEEAVSKFGRSRPVDWLVDKGELPGIFMWALAGYQRAVQRGQYEDTPSTKSARERWRLQNEAVYAFVEECCEPVKGVRNNQHTLALAARYYAKDKTNVFPKDQTVKIELTVAISEQYRSVKNRRATHAGKRTSVYEGLSLNITGRQYLKLALRDNETIREADLLVNDPIPTT